MRNLTGLRIHYRFTKGTVKTSFKLPKDMVDAIKEFAKANGVTATDIVRDILDQALDNELRKKHSESEPSE